MNPLPEFQVQEVWSQHSGQTSVVLRIDGFDFWMTHARAASLSVALQEAAGRAPAASEAESVA